MCYSFISPTMLWWFYLFIALNIKVDMTRTKNANHKRMLVAYLINMGVNTVPRIAVKTKLPKRTVENIIKTLSDLDIDVEYQGARKNGKYVINSWGCVNLEWIENNLTYMEGFI